MAGGRGRWLGRVTTGIALTGLLGLSTWGVPADESLGDRVPEMADPAAPMVLAAEESGVRQSEAEAVAEAIATGERVEIGAFRSERREVYANPDGTTTAVEHAQPVRVVRDGTWVPVDTTLVRGADGRIGPKATTLGLRLSGGGDTPLIVAERAGRSMTLDWPGTLPEPTIAADQATYAEVLPGVDLVVTVADSGFSHVLVVKTPEAAADVDLAAVEFELTTSGLAVGDDGDGGLRVVDSASQGVVFEAPTPVMWDSGVSRLTTLSTRSVVSEQPGSVDPTRAAPESANLAPVGVRLDGSTLTLTPDQAMIDDPATVWPVYIDPVWASTSNSSWAMVASGYPTTKYWKFSGTEGVGECPVSSGYCNGVGVKRLFYALPTSYSGKSIISAEFRVTMTHTYNSSAKKVSLYRAGSGISSATTWNNQPSMSVLQETISPTATQGSCTSTNQNVGFNATAAVREAATKGWSTTTFGIRAHDEGDSTAWKRFCGNAILSVNYNRAPNQPAASSLTMSPGGVCVSGGNRPYVNTPPVLYMVFTDPDSSSTATEKLHGEVSVSWLPSGGGTRVTRTSTTTIKGSGSLFQMTTPSDLPENVVVSWSARASDGTAWGASSVSCEFVYDHTQPAAPDIDSVEYLPLDGSETTSACVEDTEWRGSVGRYGTFTFDSASTDTVTYRYGFNTNPSPTTTLTPSTGGGTVSVPWLPESEGTNFVTVQAVDAAGLSSPIATCMFAVANQPAAGSWTLGEAAGSASSIDARGAHPAIAAAGAAFGVPGPGCQGTRNACELDNAVRLSGAADSYLATTSSGLVDTGTGFSVAAWVRLTDTSTDQVAVSQDGSGEPGFTLGYSAAAGRWVFGTPVTDVTALGAWSVTSTAAATANEWTHLVGVYDPVRRELGLYVNGERQATSPRRSAWRSRGAIQIGRSIAKSGYTDGWVGELADVAVFERIVVPAEAAQLSTLLPVRTAYWPLNEAVDGYSPEYGGGEDLGLSAGAQIYAPDLDADPTAEEPLLGTGHLVLDGVDGAASTQAPAVDTAGSFTVSFRARVAATPQRPMAAVSQAGTTTSGFVARCTPTRWELVVPTSDTAGAQTVTVFDDHAPPVPSTYGQHVAVVYNAFTNELRLYVDGQLASSAMGVHNQTWAAGGGLQLGRALLDGQWQDPFSGVIDDVRVYSGVADATAVANLALLRENPNL